MNRRKKIFLVLIAVCLLAALILAGQLIWGQIEYQTVSLQGYSLMVPKEWSVREEGNALFFQNDGEDAGLFSLIYSDMTVQNVPKSLGYDPEEIIWREVGGYAARIHAAEFRYNREGYEQYIFAPLKDAPPYQAVLSLNGKNRRRAEDILRSFRLPDLGNMAPDKPMVEPNEAFLKKAVYVKAQKDALLAYHVSTLDRLILAGSEQPADAASVVHILSYEVTESGENIKTWYYLSVGGGQKKLFTYQPTGTGQYYYENNPRWIKDLSRQLSEDGKTVRYLADNILLLEVPFNPYSEQKNELFGLKGTHHDEEGKISVILQKLLANHISQGDACVQANDGSFGLTVPYAVDETEESFSQDDIYRNALVLFSLVDDLDVVQFDVKCGEASYALSYTRTDAETHLEGQDLRGFAKDMTSFEGFLEQLLQISSLQNIAE